MPQWAVTWTEIECRIECGATDATFMQIPKKSDNTRIIMWTLRKKVKPIAMMYIMQCILDTVRLGAHFDICFVSQSLTPQQSIHHQIPPTIAIQSELTSV